MQAITYYITLPFIYLLSLLPFPVMYLLSDFVFFIFYHVTGYRKEVVVQNLKRSFPEKTEEEIKHITRAFYKHLCDMFLETFKTLTMSRKTVLKRCSFSPDAKALFDKLASEQQSAIMVMGHFGNWEWGGSSFSLVCQQQLYVIYHPLRNQRFDGLMYGMRTRFGTKLIAMKNTFKEMIANRNILSATAFIADQTPQPDNAYWTTFMNQETPVFWGTEIVAKKLNRPIVYVSIIKLKRGYYTMNAEMLIENPADTPDGYISEMHTRRLEKDIIAHPAIWLWSHRRWKHKKPDVVRGPGK